MLQDTLNSNPDLNDATMDEKQLLRSLFNNVLNHIKSVYIKKAQEYLYWFPKFLSLNYQSSINRTLRTIQKNKEHPIGVSRGQIYNAYLGVNLGSELCENHLVIIVQNNTGNTFGEKVNVLPIEGDGHSIKKYHVRLANTDLEDGRLTKDPSRIIITDILTIDKARLGRKIGKANMGKMNEINQKLKKQLDLF